jgi:hypothetical protein
MARKTKKTSAELATQTDAVESTSQEDSTTKTLDVSIDYSLTQLFRSDGKYDIPHEKTSRGRHWTFIVYKESAPPNWIELLIQTGLAFVVSPYHDMDKNPDGSPKKPHWHVIVSYTDNTTYNNVCGLRNITKGPFPLRVGSVSGMYAYLIHKHNPEKAQYDAADILRYNGWEKALESSEVAFIKKALTEMIFVEEITDYAELIAAVSFMDGDYQSVAMNNTVYFDRLCSSYRHNRVGTLRRYYSSCPDGELKDRVKEIIKSLG